MTDTFPLLVAGVCAAAAAACFLNIHLGRAAVRYNERRAYATALNATDFQLAAMPLDHLLDLRTRLTGFAAREQDLIDTSLAAAERLDAIIIAKDAARRLTGVIA